MLELEGWDVGYHVDLVVGVHVAAGAVGAWVADLGGFVRWFRGHAVLGSRYFYLEDVLWWGVELFVGLLAGFGEGEVC